MALIIHCETSDVLPLDEYIDYIATEVDFDDVDSIAASAPKLRALANDRELVVRHLNDQIKGAARGEVFPSAQSIFLARGKRFYVRANIWPSSADIAQGRVYQDHFAYHLPHDHNYSFMTVGYHGPGYVTEVYEYDHDKVEGYIGEQVDFRYLDTTLFTAGMVMLYRASKDMHIQYPPEDLSISLNLMTSNPDVLTRDQFLFDNDKRTLARFPSGLEGSRRVSVIEIAGHLGNADTEDMLQTLAAVHPCRRSRLTAYESLEKLAPTRSAEIWELAVKDGERLVSNAARRRLDGLGR